MNSPNEVSTLLEQVDSIQSRFLESLITGRRDPIFRDKIRRIPETKDESFQTSIDSQRGTF
jgi:hypothetical protein